MIRAMPTRHGEFLEHIDSKRNRYERVHKVLEVTQENQR
jgi:hypothetical protein